MQNINFVDYEKKVVNNGSKKIKISLYEQLMNKVNDIRREKQNLENLKREARQLDTYINDYSNYPAYCGNYIKYEPYHTEYRNTADKGVFVEDFSLAASMLVAMAAAVAINMAI